MIFYGAITLGLLLSMAGLVYLFPEYGLRLFNAAASKFWELLKPRLFKRMSPEDYEAYRRAKAMGIEWDFYRKKPKPRR